MAAVIANILVRSLRATAMLALALTQCRLEAQDQRPKVDASKYLPLGANVKDVVMADLEGNGRQEAIVFFTLAEQRNPLAGVVVLKRSNGSYVVSWQQVDSGWGFSPPTGVYRLRSARPLIIAYRSLGASCPGTLSVFQFRGPSIASVAGWPEGKCASNVDIKDLNGDGVPEIIFKPLRYGTISEIYSWDGRAYRLANSDFPDFYSSELKELLGYINTGRMLPASARVVWASEVVEIYKLQHRYSEAIRICKAVLAMIDNPELTTPSSKARDNSPEALEEARAFDQADRARNKATLHRSMGDLYTAQGNSERARAHYEEAERSDVVGRNIVR